MTKFILKYMIYLIIIFLSVSCCNTESKSDENQYDNTSNFNKDEHIYVDGFAKIKEDTNTNFTSLEDINKTQFDSDTVSYWYVYFSNNKIRGYTTIKLNTSYFSIINVLVDIKKQNGIKDDEFIGISFYSQLTESAYYEYEKFN